MAEGGAGWVEKLGSPFPAYFAFVMATGIVSLAARQLGHDGLGWALFAINLLAYAIIWASGFIRIATAPRALWQELWHHETGANFLTIVAGSAVLGSDLAARHLAPDAVIALFAFSVLAGVVLIYCFLLAITEARSKPSLQKGLSGSWLLMVVSNASLAVLGSDVLKIVGPVPPLVFFCYVSLALSWFYYVVLSAMILYRFAFIPMPARELGGPWWINEGAAAITVLAGAKLLAQPDLAVGPIPLASLISPLVAIFWADATFWIPFLALLFAWKYLVRKRPFRYSRGHWSIVFPLGMYSAATLQFAAAYGLPFLVPAAQVLFWLGLIVWAIATAGMLRRLAAVV